MATCNGAEGGESATLDNKAMDDGCNTLDPTDLPSEAANPMIPSSNILDPMEAASEILESQRFSTPADASDVRERARRLALLRQGRRGISRHKLLSELAGELARG